jgi:hypothetical protein
VTTGPVGDPERDVVQAGPALVEGLTGVGLVMMQAYDHARAGVHEDDGVTALLNAVMREHDRYPGEPEDPLIQCSAVPAPRIVP